MAGLEKLLTRKKIVNGREKDRFVIHDISSPDPIHAL
jgi:hypothetical protein